MHAAVHIKDNKIWTLMNDPPDDHNKLLERCEYHLVYLGWGNFVELDKRQHLLIVVNSTEDVKTIEIGCLTFDEEETLNSVIYRGLGWGIDPSDKTKKTGIPFVKDLIKQEPETSTSNTESDEDTIDVNKGNKSGQGTGPRTKATQASGNPSVSGTDHNSEMCLCKRIIIAQTMKCLTEYQAQIMN